MWSKLTFYTKTQTKSTLLESVYTLLDIPPLAHYLTFKCTMLSVHFLNNVYFFLYTDSFVENKKNKKKWKEVNLVKVSWEADPLPQLLQTTAKAIPENDGKWSTSISLYLKPWELIAVGVCQMCPYSTQDEKCHPWAWSCWPQSWYNIHLRVSLWLYLHTRRFSKVSVFVPL